MRRTGSPLGVRHDADIAAYRSDEQIAIGKRGEFTSRFYARDRLDRETLRYLQLRWRQRPTVRTNCTRAAYPLAKRRRNRAVVWRVRAAAGGECDKKEEGRIE